MDRALKVHVDVSVNLKERVAKIPTDDICALVVHEIAKLMSILALNNPTTASILECLDNFRF